MMKTFSLFLLVLTAGLFARAEEPFYENAFAPFFRDRAVLQRDCDLPVWGTAAPQSRVVLFIDGDLYQTTTSEEGVWRVTVPPQKAGTGHHMTLVVEGVPAATLSDIAFGDVWFCVGSDEMEASFWSGLHRGEEELQDAEYPDLRFFVQPRRLAVDPTSSLGAESSWVGSRLDDIRGLSALSFFFGRALYKTLSVPIGLVCANHGGSTASAWMPVETALGVPSLEEDAKTRQKLISAWKNGGEAALLAAQNAWDSSYDGSDPYQNADYLPSDEDFEEDDQWISTELPRTLEDALQSPAYDGTVWYRRTIFLSEAQAKQKATLHLDHIDDQDTTWFNGGKIGESWDFRVDRHYPIPQGAMRAGANLIAIRVHDTGAFGGITGDPKKLRIEFEDGSSVSLVQGLWRLRANKAPKGNRPVDPTQNPTDIGSCYNGLVFPFKGMAIRGVLWADGVADVAKPERYEETLRALIQEFRSTFSSSEGELPVYLFQPSSHFERRGEPYDSALASIRWSQMKVAEALPNVASAVTLDDGNAYLMFAPNKRVQGDRLAALALRDTYHVVEGEVESPYPEAVRVAEGAVQVTFRRCAGLKTSDEKALKGFQVAGAEGKFIPVETAEIQDRTVVLTLPEGVAKPIRIRYAWDDLAMEMCNLVGANGHPVGSFELMPQ